MAFSFTVTDSRRFLGVAEDTSIKLTAFGGTVYYGDSNVSESVNEGSLTNGQSVVISASKWFIAKKNDRVLINAVELSSTPGDTGGGQVVGGGALTPLPPVVWGSTATFALTDNPQLVEATLTASTTTALTVTGSVAKRWAVVIARQPASVGNGGLTINGQPVSGLSTTPNTVNVIHVYSTDQGGLANVISGAQSTGTSATTVTAWSTGRSFQLGELSLDSGNVYRAISAHVAGASVAADIAAGKLERFASGARYIRTLRATGSPMSVAANLDFVTVPVASKLLGVSADTDGTDLIVDLNLNGTTVFTTQANRPTTNGANSYISPEKAPDVTTVPAGSKLSIDVDSIGSVGGQYISSGTFFNVSSGATAIALDLPVGIPSGQLLVAYIIVNASATGAVITPPAGWTSVGVNSVVGNRTGWLFYRVTDGTEGSQATFNVTTGAPISKNGQIHAYTSPTATPLDDADISAGAFGTAHSLPANTTTQNGDLRVGVIALSGSTVSVAPASMTQRGSGQFYDRIVAATGATGTDAYTTAASATSGNLTAVFKVSTTSAPGSTKLNVNVRMQEAA